MLRPILSDGHAFEILSHGKCHVGKRAIFLLGFSQPVHEPRFIEFTDEP
jgi:hypothetical protein